MQESALVLALQRGREGPMVLTPTSRKTSRAIKKLRLESLGGPFLKVEKAVNIGSF